MVKIRRERRAGVKLAMLMAVAAIGLSGCGDMKSAGVDPIDWYRDLSGSSVNDPQDKAPNSKNLAEGSKEPYPNLASVPKQPDNAITKADREKMAQSLIADRQNAQYTDEKLHAGQDLTAIPPPPPAAPVVPTPKVAAAPASKVAAAPVPQPAPAVSKVAAAPLAGPVKHEALPPPNPAPKTQQMAAVTPPAPTPAAKADKTAAQARADKKKKDEAKKREAAKNKQAKSARGSEKPPEESSLRPPTIGAMPEGEEAQTAPPQPPGTPNAPLRPARSEELAAATPSRSDADNASQRRNLKVQATVIGFASGPYRARLLPAARKQLEELAKQARRDNARIRIVGYGGAPAQGDMVQREFQSFNAALDNAKAVGIELAKLGVPAARIDIETNSNVNSPDRAEVFVEH